MTKYDDALRGYAFPIHKRDGFKCVYCGLDGTLWPNWLFLSWDHLLPRGHPQRDNPDFIVTACRFCNEVHNRTVFPVEGKTPAELIKQKRPFVLEKRDEYHKFFKNEVKTRRG